MKEKVNETLFREVLRHLIINAIKNQTVDSHPKIQINSEKVNETWKLSISDNGIGIDSTQYSKVFDIYQHLNINQEANKSNGIGLAYCKKIVQLHHGEIWVEPNTQKGSTFHFTIPILTL